MHPAPQSEREDLVYHEQKLLRSSSPGGAHEDNSQKELPSSVIRQPNNPLDIAVIRLAELERNIEQRYLHLSALRRALASATYCFCFLNKYFLGLLPNKLWLVVADGFFSVSTLMLTTLIHCQLKSGRRRDLWGLSCGVKPSQRFAAQLNFHSALNSCRNPLTGNDPSANWLVTS